MDGWMGGRDFRARFTFPSTVRSFVRSSKRARLVGRRTFDGALPTCADSCNLLVARSLPPSLHIGICRLLSPPQCLTPSSSPVWFLARMFEFTRKWAWHWHTDGVRVGSRDDGGHASWLLRRSLEMRFSQSPSMNLVMWRGVHLSTQ